MKAELPERDERTVAVENAGYRRSYLTLSFGLLVLTGYRSYARHESSWDLLLLVVLGGVINTWYQANRNVLYPRWFVLTLVTLGLAAGLAIVLVLTGWAR